MPKAELQTFLAHIVDRQMLHGPEAAFRFDHIKLGGEIVPARYSEDAASNAEEEQQVVRAPRRPRRVRNRRAANDTATPPGTHVGPIARGDMSAVVNNATNRLDQRTTPMPSMVIIGQAEMDVIREKTHIIVPAHNGPGDGPPRYQVPLTLFQEIFGTIDPSLGMSNTRQVMSDASSLPPSPAPTSTDPAPRPAQPAATPDNPVHDQRHKDRNPRRRREKGDVQMGVTPGGAGRATRATTRASTRELRSNKSTRQSKRK